jgi:WD40 repeat protein
VTTGQCLRTFEGPAASAESVVFSPDGRFALSGNTDNTVRLWDVATGQCLRTFDGHTGRPETVAFSPDGRFALSGSKDNTVRLWDVATGRCLRTFKGHTHWVTSLAFSPDGRFAVSASYDKTIRLWTVATVIERRYRAPWFYSTCIVVEEALTRQGAYQQHLLRARQAYEAGQIADALIFVKQARSISGFEKSPESLELQACAGARAILKSCRGAWLKYSIKLHEDSGGFTSDGRFLLSVGGPSWPTFRLRDVVTGHCARTIEGDTNECDRRKITNGQSGGGWTGAFSPDGLYALSAMRPQSRSEGVASYAVVLWDVATGQHMRTFEGHKRYLTSVAFSPDGRFALGIGDNIRGETVFRLWDIATGDSIRVFQVQDDVISMVFSPDSRFLISFDGRARLYNFRMWDVVTAKCRLLSSFEETSFICSAVAFSPDRQFAIIAGSYCSTTSSTITNTYKLRLWDVASGQCLRTFEGHADDVKSVAFSPDGRFAVSGSDDNAVRLWDVASGQCLRTFEGHTDDVKSVAFSPDGHFVLSESGIHDKTLKLWELDWEYEYDPKHDPVLKRQLK